MGYLKTSPILGGPGGCQWKGLARDITIMGRPVELNAMESFTVAIDLPPIFVTQYLDGVIIMGCDIHLFLEWRIKTRDDAAYRKALRDGDISGVSKWVEIDAGTEGEIQNYGQRYWVDPVSSKVTPAMVEDGRNYNLFGIVAGVRNGGDPPLILPGIQHHEIPPDSVVEELQNEFTKPNGAAHNFRWFTVKQLLDYDGWALADTDILLNRILDFHTMLLALRDYFPDMDGAHEGKDLRLSMYFDS